MPSENGTTTELPAGYRVLSDGPGREVLMREEWEEYPVFSSRAEAVAWAWIQYRDYGEIERLRSLLQRTGDERDTYRQALQEIAENARRALQ